MKIVAVGIGQCGCNIVDELYNINNYARSLFGRRIEILTDAFAMNTDEADLSGLRFIPKDRNHRIVVGAMRTYGHGVGKLNVAAANIMAESNTRITESILKSDRLHESDAIVVVASGGGGTGSGSIGWVIKGLMERIQQPVYAVVVLPFRYEEKGDTSYAVTNSATCLEMVNRYAHAVFLLDNERFGRANISIAENFTQINQQMVKDFYDLFCAGEERKQKYIGSKVVDAGDIKATLEGLTIIGRGEINLSTFRSWKSASFKDEVKKQTAAAAALQQAENDLSVQIQMEDARKILALVSAPKNVITLSFLEEISAFLQDKSPKSVVRIGDYPRRRSEISVTLIASRLIKLARVEDLYVSAQNIFKKHEELNIEAEQAIRQIHEGSKNLPTLDR